MRKGKNQSIHPFPALYMPCGPQMASYQAILLLLKYSPMVLLLGVGRVGCMLQVATMPVTLLSRRKGCFPHSG